MFRPLRKKKQELAHEEVLRILNQGTHGVLALLGDEDYPYALPISYVYADGKLIFHGAHAGHKIDAIKRHAKASFCVVEQDEIVPEEYTTYFRSVIAFGQMRLIEDDDDKYRAIALLARKYYPSATDAFQDSAIKSGWKTLSVMEMTIEHLSGKEAIELVRARKS